MERRDTPLTRGLDFYKPTMSQFAFERAPEANVTFTFKNRNKEPLSRYVSPEQLRERFAAIQQNGFQPEEIAYLASLQAQDGTARFTAEYLDHLADMNLPPIEVGTDQQTGDIAIETTGSWPDVSFWETVVMSEVNEAFYQGKLAAEGLSLADLYAEGDRRLSEKIARLQARPDIKISDFGTRRRFSAAWHEHVLERLFTECPDNVVGTSNVWFAHQYGVKPIGTFAHELPMVYAALEDIAGGNPLEGHTTLLREWYELYGDDLSIALTDTFGSEYFFTDFTPEQAAQWRGLRHDSGDPFAFGERVIAFYEQLNINPREKTLVFSDGLDIDMIEKLADHFGDRIQVLYGWGTTLTNDLGLKANNFVMKATKVTTPENPTGAATVKLSDAHGKHTGPERLVQRYQTEVAAAIARRSVGQLVRV